MSVKQAMASFMRFCVNVEGFRKAKPMGFRGLQKSRVRALLL
jgi:hypothetical protein